MHAFRSRAFDIALTTAVFIFITCCSTSGTNSYLPPSSNDNLPGSNNNGSGGGGGEQEGLPVFSAVDGGSIVRQLPSEIDDCAVIGEKRCRLGITQTCAIYNSVEEVWPENPDPLLDQIYHYDRYFDLYHRMEGQHAVLEFNNLVAAGTPEEEWSDPSNFGQYESFGDGSGWTGNALFAAASRYMVTGTEADYQRVVDQFEAMAFLYEANGIPGMIMRSHFAMLEEGAPKPHGLPGKAISTYIEPEDWHFRYPLQEPYLSRLPSYYTEGVDIDGTHYATTPLWMGDASRDMYVRSLPGIMLAYDLLRMGEKENAVRRVIENEIPCTLKRMKKLRISNLQNNPDLIESLQSYFNSGTINGEPDDFDLTFIDEIIGYVMEQPNPEYMDSFDAGCPDTLPFDVDPEYDFDASSDTFLLDFTDLMARSSRQGEHPIAWMMYPSVRGSDAMFMTQWALAGHYFTGDRRFVDFLEKMMGEVPYWEALDLMGSFTLPKWCRSHFGPSLLYPTLWNLQFRIKRDRYPTFWNSLASVIAEEIRYKELVETNDVFFALSYNEMVDEDIDPDVKEYVTQMAAMLDDNAPYQVLDPNEPRRDYPIDLQEHQPEGFDEVVLEDLSEEDRAICETPLEIMGVPVDPIGLSDEEPRAKVGMPLKFRVGGDFIWQMDPYMIKRTYWNTYTEEGVPMALRQWPAQGISAAYWLGRRQEIIEKGAGMALGWKDTQESCEEE